MHRITDDDGGGIVSIATCNFVLKNGRKRENGLVISKTVVVVQ
jgi:hypothetical protein